MKKLYCLFILCLCILTNPTKAATVVATVNGKPVTDTDVTARTKLMARQGNVSSDNRRVALQSIIDDYVKLAYAGNFNVTPDDKIVDKELNSMNLQDLTISERDMARNAIRANIAWQIVVARTVLPMVDVSDDDLQAEKNALAKERGLPIEMTIIRLTDIPSDIAKKLTKPKDCDDAMSMAQNLGGVPQKFTAVQYELSEDIRNRTVGLPVLNWSPIVDNNILLVCSTKKTEEYGKLDDMIKQNTMYRQAMFMADQQLKQLRRKAVIVFNDDRYKL